MESRLSWILPVPFLIFLIACWIFNQSENEARVQMARGNLLWQEGDYSGALETYQAVYRKFPNGRYADAALWEMGTISYIRFHDIDAALIHFHRLATQYPHSPLAGDVYLKLAEIHELELSDLPGAIACWSQTLSLGVTSDIRRRAQFLIGNAYLKLNEFDRAFASFTQLIEAGEPDQLSHRAQVRLGTLRQIENQFAGSVPYFEQALEQTDCLDCRRSARLGLIESYEFLGQLDKAIEVAEAIPASEFDLQEKEKLLERLWSKARYYEPGLWAKE